MPHQRRPTRLGSFEYVGEYEYFVTCCAHERHEAFVDSQAVKCLRAEFLCTCEERCFSSRICTFMPDHVHFLVRGEMPDAAFLPFMKLLRQRTAVAYRNLRGERLWQTGYFERVLRPRDDWNAVAQYILQNPVRAGLVETAENYPFSYLGHSERSVCDRTPVTPPN
jgi:REP element-mobilizing transposase RayT